LLLLVLTREDGEASVQLGQDATKTPHVDSHVIVHAKNDFRRAVETTLDVCVHYKGVSHATASGTTEPTLFVFEAAATEVDHLQSTLARMHEEHILRGLSQYHDSTLNQATHFRFQIAVNDPMMAHQHKSAEHLGRETADQGCGEANETICLDQFVQIDAEKLHRNAEMVAEVKVLRHLDDMVFLLRILLNL
jgi:hypothetical protein